MNRLVRAFIEFMDCVAGEGYILAGRSIGYSLQYFRESKRVALKELKTLRIDAEQFDNHYYSQFILSVLMLALKHPERRAFIMAHFHEYCEFQCSLELLATESSAFDLLQEHGLGSLTRLRPDKTTLRPHAEETIRTFEQLVSGGQIQLDERHRELVAIIYSASQLYDIDLSSEAKRAVDIFYGDDDSDSLGTPPLLQ